MNTHQDILLADQTARRRIRDDIGTNFFVEAGAGSGKTTALVERMVSMVENGIDVSRICAITFTVAASREFYARFQERLIRRQAEEDLPEEMRRRFADALAHIDLCFMGTIDSFCGLVLGEHPTRAGIPSTLAIQDEASQAGIYRREFARIKGGEYGGELLRLYRLFTAVHRSPDDVFMAGIAKFMSAHAADWVLPPLPEESWTDAFGDEVAHVHETLAFLSAHTGLLSRSNGDGREAAEKLPDAAEATRDPLQAEFSDILYHLRGISADGSDKRTGVQLACDPASAGVPDPALFSLRGTRGAVYVLPLKAPNGLVSRMNAYRYAVTARFLAASAKAMAVTLKASGEMSFYDTLLYLRDMLRADARTGGVLTAHIRARHAFFLIDEFQDTDPMQAEIFFRLASAEPREDWRDCRPVPGSLFIVGDPKQSIYRFRGADVSSYLAVKHLFVPPVGEILSLQQNFRSVAPLITWFNGVFRGLLPDETAFQSRFEPIPEDGVPSGGSLAGLRRYLTAAESSAADVAALVRTLLDDPGVTIRPRKEDEPRRLRCSDIMIITRTKQPIADLLGELSYKGIPCMVEGCTAFASSRAFLAMTDIVAALAHPADSAFVYRALRSDVFRLRKGRLTAWRTGGRPLTLQGHEEGSEDPVSQALEQLDAYRLKHISQSPAALCRSVVSEYGLFRRCGSEDMEYVWFAIELLRANEGCSSWADASAFLDALADGSAAPDRYLSLSGETDRVRLANLHKVKGLEAPVVILAYAKKSQHPVSLHMESDGPQQKRWLLRLENSSGSVCAETDGFPDEKSREEENRAAEEIRMMYVAATRAGCALFLPDIGRKTAWSLLDASAAPVFPVPIFDIEADLPDDGQDGDLPAETVEEESLLAYRDAEEATWQLRTPSGLADADMEPDRPAGPEDASGGLPRGQRSSALLGTAVHRALEMLVSSGAKLPDESIVRAIRDELDLDNRPDGPDALPVLRSTLRVVRQGGWPQENGLPADILGELMSADEVHCEVPFSEADGSAVTSGQMDVVYRKGADWHIVDYKTNADPYGLDVVYAAQLGAYRDAVRRIFGVEADAHAYHVPLQSERP